MGTEVTTDHLERARHGDMEAFMALFHDARPMVFSVAYRIVGADDAEDVLMETTLKAWKALPGFTGRAGLRTWLCRIAHNCAVDYLRRRPRWAAQGSDESPEGADPAALPDRSQRHPVETMAGAELETQIQAALGTLSPEHRATLLLRFVDGLGYAEIAAATGVSIGPVMSRLFNGRRKMMRLLKETRENLS
jgi:RNA polymerase sigma-70 factor (ECF subfamily)